MGTVLLFLACGGFIVSIVILIIGLVGFLGTPYDEKETREKFKSIVKTTLMVLGAVFVVVGSFFLVALGSVLTHM